MTWFFAKDRRRPAAKPKRRHCSHQALEVRDYLSGVPQQSAADVLNFVVAQNYSTIPTVNGLLATVDFDEFFQNLETDELMNLLISEGMVRNYTSVEGLKTAVANWGIDLSTLRPDGVLTQLTVSTGGSLLTTSAVLAKSKLESEFDLNPAHKLAMLDSISTQNLLELFDPGLTTSASDTRDNYIAYSIRQVGAGQADPNSPAYLSNLVPGYAITMTANGPLSDVPDVQAAVNALKNMPAGGRSVYSGNMFGVDGFGPWSNVTMQGFLDPTGAGGARSDYFFLSADLWSNIVRNRYDAYFHQLRDAIQTQLVNTHIIPSVDDALNYYVLDMESNSLSYQAMFDDRRVDPNSSPRYTYWQELLGDPSVGLQANASWQAIKPQMLAAGLTERDLSLSVLPTWDKLTDPRVAIWNSVMDARRTALLETAIYDPIRIYFPNVQFSNFDNYNHNRTVPTGSFTRFVESSNSIGSPAGTSQAAPLYGIGRTIITPDPSIGTLTSTPPPQTKIWQVTFNPTSQNGNVVTGVATITLGSRLSGVKVGDTVRLTNQGNVYIDPAYEQTTTVLTINDVVVQGKTVTRVTVRLSADHVLPNFDLSSRLPSNLSDDAYFVTWQSYASFLSDLNSARSMVSTSSVPITPWITSPNYTTFLGLGNYSHWQEDVFHAALSGAEDFLYWRLSDMGGDEQGSAVVNSVLKRLDALVGFDNRNVITREPISLTSDVAISAIEAGGRVVMRVTPDPTVNFTITQSTVQGVPQVTIRVGNDAPIVISHATYLNPADDPIQNAGKPLGYWIVQTQRDDFLVGSVANVMSALQNQNQTATINIMADDQTVRGALTNFYITPAGSAVVQGATYYYSIDWNGDGSFDQYFAGPAGASVPHVFSDSGIYTIKVAMVDPVHGWNVWASKTVHVDAYTLLPNATNPNLTDLVYGTSTTGTVVVPIRLTNGVIAILTMIPGTAGYQVTDGITGVTGKVMIYGQRGNDTFVDSWMTDMPAEYHGGGGVDTFLIKNPSAKIFTGTEGTSGPGFGPLPSVINALAKTASVTTSNFVAAGSLPGVAGSSDSMGIAAKASSAAADAAPAATSGAGNPTLAKPIATSRRTATTARSGATDSVDAAFESEQNWDELPVE